MIRGAIPHTSLIHDAISKGHRTIVSLHNNERNAHLDLENGRGKSPLSALQTDLKIDMAPHNDE